MEIQTVFIILTILAAIGVGWSIGANDAANSMGVAVGARVITMRQAIIQISIFGLLGAVFQGQHVTATIGKGIVDLPSIRTINPMLATQIALVSTFASCLWVALATYFKMPISTSHSIVGAVAGAGLAVSEAIKWKVLGNVFICWMLTPAGAALLGYVIYRVVQQIFLRWVSPRIATPLLRVLILVSGWYVAFSWGANDVANAVGLISGADIMRPSFCLLLGGLAIVFGVVTWGSRVIETIGSNITNLLPAMAFSTQLASALNVHLYTLLGVPVSTSHSIVGAIFGVGLVRGVKAINLGIMKEIATCWVATPFISGILSFLTLKLIRVFIN
jgi:PiT family inorganic phosphate transporter